MASVNIIRYNPIGIFSGTTQTVITYDDESVVHHVEPSGNVGTQYAGELGSEWFGTIHNLHHHACKVIVKLAVGPGSSQAPPHQQHGCRP